MAPHLCLLIALVVVSVSQVDAYGSGAPYSTCFTQYPKHHNQGTQTSQSEFVITFNPKTYTPNQIITIQVTDSSSNKIMGIQMAGRRENGNPNEIVGSYMDLPDKLRAFNCFGGSKNMLTHSHKGRVSSLSFKWKAPGKNVGIVIFRATILRNFNTFWYNVTATLPVDNSVTEPIQPPMQMGKPLGSFTTPIDFDACGDTKGCFYYPRHCSGSHCIAVATYFYRKATDDYMFELHLNHDGDYISLGFSDDQIMGADATVSCTGRTGVMSVQEGRNPGHYNERNLNTFSSSHEVRYQDGYLQCNFVLPKAFNVYKMKQDTTVEPNYDNDSWDITKDWYLMLAWGATMPESDVLAHHHDLPAISSSRVDLKENKITYSSAFHVMVKAHAAVMMVAWILLTGIVTVVSRHYREWFAKKRLFGTKIWFQIHRELAIVVVALTVIGIILIFAHYGSGIRTYAVPHAYVGLAVVACVGVQMLAGMLRPGLDNNARPIFNWCHRFMGHTTHILSAATMFLAFDISYINSDMKRFGFIVLSLWVVIQVLWHLLFEAISQRYSKPAQFEMYGLGVNNDKPMDERATVFPYNSMFLIIYFICLTGLCVAALCSFLMY